MAKVITFSRTFPSYHPKAGQPTYFVEKIWESIYMDNPDWLQDKHQLREMFDLGGHNVYRPKHHTIRAGHRWKVGDKFSPRVWSGKPYKSRQIIIGPDIEVKKVWDVEFDDDGCLWIYSNKERGPKILDLVAKNDGLTKQDLFDWFNKPFTGQIICWNENINY